ncbi:MAG: MurR/RpiR family transcriptional regulator [Marinovum sp.]|jgi:RpiR family transcriptional regulator, carbohydrate utilization regulator|nr:MurR/RpiR family transcriptional regulator [Marinovum sp.]MBT6526782.1 MurR/RpiR family transcriptional regulator [Marinovum sp.]
MSIKDSRSNLPLSERIQTNYGLLKNAERKVADFLMQNPGLLLESSITEFSRQLGVSEATISRFSKAIGYDGYPALKLSIAAGTSRSAPLPNMPTEINEGDSISEMGRKLQATLSLSIQMTNSSLDLNALEEAVEKIGGAKRLIFIGVGGAASICVEAMHLFVKAGRQAESISDGYTQIAAATSLNEGDTLVGVSHTGQTRSVAHALSLAAKNGAATVAITSDKKSEVARAADTVLTTWNSQSKQVPLFGDFLEGRMSQLFLIDLVYLNALFKSENNEKGGLMMTGDALKRYYQIT